MKWYRLHTQVFVSYKYKDIWNKTYKYSDINITRKIIKIKSNLFFFLINWNDIILSLFLAK